MGRPKSNNMETDEVFFVFGIDLRNYIDSISTVYFSKTGDCIIYSVNDIEMQIAECLESISTNNFVNCDSVLLFIERDYTTIMELVTTDVNNRLFYIEDDILYVRHIIAGVEIMVSNKRDRVGYKIFDRGRFNILISKCRLFYK